MTDKEKRVKAATAVDMVYVAVCEECQDQDDVTFDTHNEAVNHVIEEMIREDGRVLCDRCASPERQAQYERVRAAVAAMKNNQPTE